MDYPTARAKVLMPLLAGQKLLALAQGAQAAGWMPLLRAGTDVGGIADATGMDPGAVGAILRALAAGGVVEQTGDSFVLTEAWTALVGEEAIMPFDVMATGADVTSALFRSFGSEADYWAMPAADRLALAASASPDPIHGAFVNVVQAWAEEGQPFALAVSQASTYLELGCGLAGAALSQLQAFPNLTTVAIELSDDLADEAERRAAALGVANRFSVVRGNAAEFEPDGLFDVGFWSQFFFASAYRAGAVETLFRHVRPGGLVGAPVRWLDEDKVDPTSTAAQDYAMFRVTAQAWGVPERRPDDVAEELAAAGFSDPQVLQRGPTHGMVTVTRP